MILYGDIYLFYAPYQPRSVKAKFWIGIADIKSQAGEW